MRERHPDLTVNVTGKALLYTAMQDDLAANTVREFGTAVIPITLVQALFFRSMKVGLLTMIPNPLPILAVFGLMGLFGIPLDPGSAMVAQVAIGIVVDNTVHFFSRYLTAREQGRMPAGLRSMSCGRWAPGHYAHPRLRIRAVQRHHVNSIAYLVNGMLRHDPGLGRRPAHDAGPARCGGFTPPAGAISASMDLELTEDRESLILCAHMAVR